ncbi:UDP-diphosphatase [Kouleothrix aurantiaca]|uniref:Undecaprenyl-diphosphatase n=1 Tax=Kouleothrix aurantiaca TaxID=186479 RepID=A0A0P9FNG7_9CHLR|nr:UDP-diphosphatase [Kouleothrix aurantiaca]
MANEQRVRSPASYEEAPVGDWFNVVLLGIVEGLTEFLPISSTAHLLIVAKMLGFRNDAGGTFEIFIQSGAILAVLGFYARDLLAQARTLPHDAMTRRFWTGALVAFLPAALVGMVMRTWIKAVLFGSPMVIAGALIVGGVILIIIELLPRRLATTSNLTHVSLRQAFGIGVAQVFALVPGISRSGASIVGGLLAGLDRATATRFSFYLAIPTLGAATLLDLVSSLDQLVPGDLGRLVLGALVSLVVAWMSIGWLLRYVAHNGFVAFGVYRIVVGAVVLALVALGRL